MKDKANASVHSVYFVIVFFPFLFFVLLVVKVPRVKVKLLPLL